MVDNVAVDAAFLVLVMRAAAVDLVQHAGRDDGQRNELGVRVLQRRSGRRALVFENQDVAQPTVFPEIQDAVAVSPEDVLEMFLGQARQRRLVIGGLDDHLVGAHAVHPVIDADPLARDHAFDLQSGKLVRDHTDAPARGVGRASVRPIRKDLRRRLRFVARTERTERLGRHRRQHLAEVGRPMGPLGRNDHPPADDGIASQLRHGGLL